MKYHVKYAILCHKGLVRGKNQDNFWCANVFLESENEGLSEMQSGMIDVSIMPAFAVFDGMGGEQQGEVAAYIAASHFDSLYYNKTANDIKLFLLDSCMEINKAIYEYQQENHVKQMGTTAAILMCGQDSVFICNIGDSRIYQHNGKKLTQISHDHSETSITNKKAPLTQNLGIPESEFVIEPYIAKGIYRNGDRYLLCSDGLTDMVSDDEISSIIASQNDIVDTADKLLARALEKGGMDNITIILCEIFKQKRLFSRSKK